MSYVYIINIINAFIYLEVCLTSMHFDGLVVSLLGMNLCCSLSCIRTCKEPRMVRLGSLARMLVIGDIYSIF